MAGLTLHDDRQWRPSISWREETDAVTGGTVTFTVPTLPSQDQNDMDCKPLAHHSTTIVGHGSWRHGILW